LEKRPQNGLGNRVFTIRLVTGPAQPKQWAYVAHDALGLLVKEVNDPSSPALTGYFFPWHTIVEIR
jgi:hypothetical protein